MICPRSRPLHLRGSPPPRSPRHAGLGQGGRTMHATGEALLVAVVGAALLVPAGVALLVVAVAALLVVVAGAVLLKAAG